MWYLVSRLSANLIPAVWVPPQEVRELRALVTHRNRLVQQRTQAANRLHSVLQRQNIAPPPGTPFAVHQREWWLALDLPPAEKLRVQQDLSLYQTLAALIQESDAELGRLSTCDPWVKQVPFLVQLPGLGVLSAMRILAAIGKISRFPSAKHLVGYAGEGGQCSPGLVRKQAERSSPITVSSSPIITAKLLWTLRYKRLYRPQTNRDTVDLSNQGFV